MRKPLIVIAATALGMVAAVLTATAWVDAQDRKTHQRAGGRR